MKKEKKDWKPIIIYVLIFFVCTSFIQSLLMLNPAFAIEKGDELIINIPSVYLFMMSFIESFIAFAILIFMYGKRIILGIKQIDGSMFKNIILGSIFIIVLSFGLSYVYSVLGINLNNQDAIMDMFNSYKLLTFFDVVLFAPVIEEFIFRYSFKTVINNNFLFVIISSLFFGLIHVHGFGFDIIPYVLIGFLLSLVYLKSNKNIAASIICHLLNNFIAVLSMLL